MIKENAGEFFMRNQFRGNRAPFRERLARFFYGRNGFDTLAKAVWWTALILIILNMLLGTITLWFLSLVLYAYAIFRIMSRNYLKRQKENLRFKKIISRPRNFFRLRKNQWRDRKTHVYRKCPQCKNVLRLPKRKGSHTVNCPCCHRVFSVKI